MNLFRYPCRQCCALLSEICGHLKATLKSINTFTYQTISSGQKHILLWSDLLDFEQQQDYKSHVWYSVSTAWQQADTQIYTSGFSKTLCNIVNGAHCVRYGALSVFPSVTFNMLDTAIRKIKIKDDIQFYKYYPQPYTWGFADTLCDIVYCTQVSQVSLLSLPLAYLCNPVSCHMISI